MSAGTVSALRLIHEAVPRYIETRDAAAVLGTNLFAVFGHVLFLHSLQLV